MSPELMGRIAERLYFGIQRLRRGVTQSMVREASDLLDGPWPDVRDYVEGRLEQNYCLDGLEGLHWLRDQPVRKKAHYRHIYSALPVARFDLTMTRRTSGSTGKPFVFRRDRDMLARMDAAMWAAYSWHGIRPGDRMARFWGRPLAGFDQVKRKIVDGLLRQRRMNAFNVSPPASKAFHDALIDWKPKWAYGYPTLMREFMEHVRVAGGDGRELQLEVVITTGEILDPSTRAGLEDFFACPVVNEYGCSESGILSIECEEGRSHIIPVAAYAEVHDQTSPTGDVQTGPVLATDLFGDAMPFVRYTLEDVARLHPPVECPCGRDLPQLEILTGREDTFIQLPDGRQVYDAVLAYSVPPGVAQFQVRQTQIDRLEGQIIVAQDRVEVEVVEECRRRWQQAVGEEVWVEVAVVDQIERSGTGKRRYFLPLDAVESEERSSSS